MDTKFARSARERQFNPRQIEVLIGSLLGDGHLTRTTRGYAFRVNHSIVQREYVDWKYHELMEFVNSEPDVYQDKYYFRTISHPYLSELRNEFYRGSRKIVPDEIDVTPLILSIWIMDDGTREGRQLRLNSQSFTLDENQKLSRILEAKLGIETTINRDKNLFRLRVRGRSMIHLRSITSPYILPSMLYKLSL